MPILINSVSAVWLLEYVGVVGGTKIGVAPPAVTQKFRDKAA
jgi:hypothetical protein